jgi:plastocyanin
MPAGPAPDRSARVTTALNRGRPATVVPVAGAVLVALSVILGACGTGGGSPANSVPAGSGTAQSPAAISSGSAPSSVVPGSPTLPAASTPATTGSSGEPASSAEATPPQPSSTPGRATVVMRNLVFSPTVLTVDSGTTVVFANEDSVGHMPANGQDGQEATNPFFAPIDLPVGASASVIFSAPGVYPITCLIHPGMNMTITVK